MSHVFAEGDAWHLNNIFDRRRYRSLNVLGQCLVAFLHSGRATNSLRHTNWEHLGVKPDVAGPAAEALKVAQVGKREGRTAAIHSREGGTEAARVGAKNRRSTASAMAR